MMIFSFKPLRPSIFDAIEASASTLVVSWKEAAESQLSVVNDACVIPSNRGSAVAGSAFLASDSVFSFFFS